MNDWPAPDYATGLEIGFACPDPHCEGSIDDFVEYASFDTTAERMSDGHGITHSTVSCSDCGAEFELQVIASVHGLHVSVIDHPDITVEFEDSTGDDYDVFDEHIGLESTDTFAVFERAIDDLRTLFGAQPVLERTRGTFNRMIFLNAFIAMEAYLGDRLKKLVLADTSRLVALVGSDGGLRDMQVKLIEVAGDPRFVQKKVLSHLRSVSFHDLVKARKLYRAVMRVDLYPDEDEEAVKKLVELRHDLVHRNGRDHDGEERLIAKEMIPPHLDMICKIIGRAEKGNEKMLVAKWFEEPTAAPGGPIAVDGASDV